MSEAIDQAIDRYGDLIRELDSALAHAHTVIEHFRNGELARAGAHGLSVRGHLTAAERLMQSISQEWARHSTP